MRVRHDTVILERRFVPKGQVIIKEGDYGQQAYLIQSGEVGVYLSKEDAQVEVARLAAGQIVGEMAFISDGPRTATVKAVADCNLIIISRQQFEEKLRESDATIRAIVHMLSQRIVESNNILLNKKSDLQDLKDTGRIIYENILGKLPQNQAWNFQNTVLPHLESLMESIEAFHERYGDTGE